MERTEAKGRTSGVYQLAVCGVMAAVLCALAPLAIPVGPVPVTLATLVVYLMGSLLGWKWGTAACLAYLLAGPAGLPVFSGYGAGAGVLLGPTGGYLIGYLPMTFLTGWVADHTDRRWALLLAMIGGTALCYALGTAWYCTQSGSPLGAALGVCVVAFLPFDLLKMLAVLAIGPVIRRRLQQARLLA